MKKILFFILAIAITKTYSQNASLIKTGYSNSFGKLALPSKNTIYILDDNTSTFLSSTNEGQKWDSIALPCDSAYYRFHDMQFVDENVGYIWGVAGSPFTNGTKPYFLKTIDKGKHWTAINIGLPSKGVSTGAQFFNANDGLCFLLCKTHSVNGNHNPEIYYTHDGGQTWQINIYNNTLYGDITKFSFADNLTGWATGANNNLFVSQTYDGGLTWQTKELNKMGGSGTGIKFLSMTDGILLSNDTILVTADGGDTWTKSKFPFAYNISSFDFAEDNTGYFVVDNSVYATKDKGATWQTIYTSSNLYFSDIKIYDGVAYVTATDGYVLKLSINPNSISEKANDIKDIAIYPNPTNSTTMLSYTLTGSQATSIELYNTLGEQVVNLVNEIQSSGKHTLTIDLAKYNAGLYFLKTSINGNNQVIRITKN